MTRFRYSVTSPAQNELESLPRLPLLLSTNNKQLKVDGLLDSGATINVLPYQIGVELGENWVEEKALIKLAGNLASFPAIPILVMAKIADFKPVQLAFAWVKTNNVPLF